MVPILDGKTTDRLSLKAAAIVASILLAVALDDLITNVDTYFGEH